MRKLERIITSQVAPVGTFTVRRALPDRARQSIGPWVFLDHFGPFRVKPGADGVGAHPHAGIETVTYLLSGRNEHRDSAGHRGVVGPGGAQWMTAGRGIIHAEAPIAENEAEKTMHGIQLWTTLPRALKMMAPRYQRIEAADIPEVAIPGGRVRVVAGGFDGGTQGPAEALMPLLLWHVSLEGGAEFRAAVPKGFEVGIYVIGGEARFDADTIARQGELPVLENADGDLVFANAGQERLDAMVLAGAPAEGPLLFHGPFVMNSVEQLRYAERAYATGRMGVLAEA